MTKYQIIELKNIPTKMANTQLTEVEYMNIHDSEQDSNDRNKASTSRNDSMSDADRNPLGNSRSQLTTSSHGKLTLKLTFAIMASAIGSSFQHGYNTGVVNAPEKFVSQFINETYFQRTEAYADQKIIDMIFSVIVSIFCIGGCIGALLTAFVAEKLGRRNGLLYNNALVILAVMFMGSARGAKSYEMMIFGRFLIGVNAGLNAGIAPMYLTEISPNHMRGGVGTIYQLVITISILLSNVFGMPGLLGTEQYWSVLFVIPIIPSLFMLATLPLCPESPKHLLIVQGSELQAQRALSWFRETLEVHDEMDELRAEGEISKNSPNVTFRDMLTNPCLRTPLIISVVVMLSQQLSGINAVMFFSTSIFKSAGLSDQKALSATLGMGILNVCMTIISLLIVDKAGRKTLHMTGLLGMSITTFIISICLAAKDSSVVFSYVSVILIYVFIVMFACGPGSIPWFLVAELFGANARSVATSIAVAVNWSANFLVSLAFLPLTHILHGYTFLLFSALLFIFYLFTYYKVPETKGTTIEEITAIFQQQRQRSLLS